MDTVQPASLSCSCMWASSNILSSEKTQGHFIFKYCNFCLLITARDHNVHPYKTTDADIHTVFLVSLSSGSKMNSIFLPVGLCIQYLEEHPSLFPFY